MQKWLVNRRDTQCLARGGKAPGTPGLKRLRNALASSALALVAVLTPQVALADAPASWLVGKAAAALEDGDAAVAFMRGRPLALPRVPPEYRRQIAPWFRELLLARRGAEFQMATISSCLALCREGRAVTVAPRSLLEDDLRAGRLKPLPLDAGVTVSACAYRLRSHPLSQAASEVWRLLRRGALRQPG